MGNRIGSYNQDSKVQLGDKVLGTDKDTGRTKNFSIESMIPIIFGKGLSNPDIDIDLADGLGTVIEDFNTMSPVVLISAGDFVLVRHNIETYIFVGGAGTWGLGTEDIAVEQDFIVVQTAQDGSGLNGDVSINGLLTAVAIKGTTDAYVDIINEDFTVDLGDFTTEGDVAWALDGSSAKSGAIADNQVSDLVLTQVIPKFTKITFDWRQNSEACCDFLEFFINGTLYWHSKYEEADAFKTVSFITPIEVTELRFRYKKDSNTSVGDDAAWIDRVLVQGVTRYSMDIESMKSINAVADNFVSENVYSDIMVARQINTQAINIKQAVSVLPSEDKRIIYLDTSLIDFGSQLRSVEYLDTFHTYDGGVTESRIHVSNDPQWTGNAIGDYIPTTVFGIHGDGQWGILLNPVHKSKGASAIRSKLQVGFDRHLADHDDPDTFHVDGTIKSEETIQGAGFKSSDGSIGASGTFTTNDGKTVTVKNGLITNIV